MGASGTDTRVSVGQYVDHLTDALIDVLDAEPDLPLPHALADALRSAVGTLRLMPASRPPRLSALPAGAPRKSTFSSWVTARSTSDRAATS